MCTSASTAHHQLHVHLDSLLPPTELLFTAFPTKTPAAPAAPAAAAAAAAARALVAFHLPTADFTFQTFFLVAIVYWMLLVLLLPPLPTAAPAALLLLLSALSYLPNLVLARYH
jgi:hypothetical protein